ncbi:MAG TPA: serine hydrolase [Patescibacteria group bacterium]|nr:serine hydrolase [Patescibacteria group bacterium]
MDKHIFTKIIGAFLIYSLLLLFVGRQLNFIPQIHFGSKKVVTTQDTRKQVLDKFLKGEKGEYSIYYKNLKTGEEFGIDENKVQTAASLNKLPYVAYLYNQAGKGKINLQDQITIQKDDIQDYGTGSLRYAEPGGSYSLKTLTKLAMEQSDNTAAHVLGVRLGVDNVQSYTNSLGMLATNLENNTTSAKDMGTILEDLYMGKVVNSALKLELLDFMKDTDFEDRLARNIPKTVSVYHKAGDGVGFVHDAGIIDDGKNPFILVVMTAEVPDIEHAKSTIGKIAQFIYQK